MIKDTIFTRNISTSQNIINEIFAFLILFLNIFFIKEMDLIEVLWKQDVDLGYNPSLSASTSQKETTAEDDIEKLKALLEMKDDKV